MGAATFTLDSKDRTVKVIKSPRGLVAKLDGVTFFRYDRASDTVRLWPTPNVGVTYRIALRRMFQLTGMRYEVTRRSTLNGITTRVHPYGEAWRRKPIKPALKLKASDFLRGLELPAGASAA